MVLQIKSHFVLLTWEITCWWKLWITQYINHQKKRIFRFVWVFVTKRRKRPNWQSHKWNSDCKLKNDWNYLRGSIFMTSQVNQKLQNICFKVKLINFLWDTKSLSEKKKFLVLSSNLSGLKQSRTFSRIFLNFSKKITKIILQERKNIFIKILSLKFRKTS